MPSEIMRPTTDTSIEMPRLQRGSKGSYVLVLQLMLLNRFYDIPDNELNLEFGEQTEQEVINFQRDWGLEQTGIVDDETWKMLESTPERQKLYTVTIPHLNKE